MKKNSDRSYRLGLKIRQREGISCANHPHPPPPREEVRAAGRTTGKKAFAAGRTTGKRDFAAPQARGILPHHRQEGFCRTTGKRAFAAPQARGILPHHRQEGFCRTSGKRAFATPQARWFCCLTMGKQDSCRSR